MANSDTTIAAAALAIAVFALFSTLAQIVGQFLATADGLRRCQPSVMDGWAKLTRLKWRWSQFRFEVLFTTPTISIYDSSTAQRINSTWQVSKHSSRASPRTIFAVLGSEVSYKETLVSRKISADVRHELASWVSFLQAIHTKSQEIISQTPQADVIKQTNEDGLLHGFPVVRFRERSWDFMPPDVVRPFASVTISDIAVLARRMGMRWLDFEPNEGILKAEGNGHLFNSLPIRGVGTVLQYTYAGDDASLESHETKERPLVRQALASREMYPWREEVDGLGFGILPGYPDLSVPKLKIGTETEVLATLSSIDESGRSNEFLKDLMEGNPGWTAGFADLIPMVTPMLRIRGTTLAHIPAPSVYCTGLTTHQPGFQVFHYNLQTRLEEEGWATDQRREVLNQYKYLHKKHGIIWEDDEETGAGGRGRGRSVEFLDDVQACYDSTTDYFIRLTDGKNGVPRLRFYDLVKCHIIFCISYFEDARESIDAGEAREDFGYRTDWIVEGAHIYWDKLPNIVKEMMKRGCEDEGLIIDAWVTLMFRAFCWHRCHFLVAGPRVDSQYFGSRQPVYIG